MYRVRTACASASLALSGLSRRDGPRRAGGYVYKGPTPWVTISPMIIANLMRVWRGCQRGPRTEAPTRVAGFGIYKVGTVCREEEGTGAHRRRVPSPERPWANAVPLGCAPPCALSFRGARSLVQRQAFLGGLRGGGSGGCALSVAAVAGSLAHSQRETGDHDHCGDLRRRCRKRRRNAHPPAAGALGTEA